MSMVTGHTGDRRVRVVALEMFRGLSGGDDLSVNVNLFQVATIGAPHKEWGGQGAKSNVVGIRVGRFGSSRGAV
jgi:hypothetical protein